jgi:O-antigen/teichoic acid export membrane protein
VLDLDTQPIAAVKAVAEGRAAALPNAAALVRSLLRPLYQWAAKGGFALLDQGLISGSNFLMGILLARWLAPAQYGAYALAFSIFLLLSIIYQAVLLEPMMVFGGSAERSALRGYLRVLVRLHSALVFVLFGTLGVAAVFAHSLLPWSELPGALAGAAVAGPCVLIFWLARRAFYLDVSVARAALGAVVYCVLLVCGLLIAERGGLISSFSAFLLMGLAALITGVVLLRQLWAALPAGGGTAGSRATWSRHWRYGRWALAGSVAGWIPAHVYYPLLASFSGMTQAGELRALMNFVQPLAQFYAALSALFLPHAARLSRRSGRRGMMAAAMKISLLFVAATVGYWAILIPFREPAFHMLYGSNYISVTRLIPAVTVGSVLWSGTFGSSIALRAMESPSSIFFAFCMASAASVAVGIPATRAFGVPGAVWAMNTSDAVALIIIIWLLLRRLNIHLAAGRIAMGMPEPS